jgi:hypothetical protein
VKEDDITWQEFEERTRDVLSAHDFKVKFREVFRTEQQGYQIDVVGYRKDLCVCLDAKRYTKGHHRASALREQARHHYYRCIAHEKKFGIRSIPVIVSLIDDSLMVENGSIIVPFDALNDFLLNLDQYLEELSY